MALSSRIGREDLHRLAPALGRGLACFQSLAGRHIEIGEAFEVWKLGIVEQTDDSQLADLAVPTGRYYVQIYATTGDQPAVPQAVASVTGLEASEPVLAGLFDTWLAEAMNQAIDDVDRSERVPANVIARLLIAPAYRVLAFWFPQSDDELIYVVSALRDLERIRNGQWMKASQFVTALADEQFVRGLIDDEPSGGSFMS